MNENGTWEFDENGNPHYVPPRESTYSTSHRTPAPRKSRKNDDGDWHWIAIVAGFIIFWPIGVALLVAELSGKWKDSADVTKTIEKASKTVKNVARDFSDHYNANMEKAEAKERAEKQAKKQEISAKKAAKKAKKLEKDLGRNHGLGHAGALRGWGITLMAIFGFSGIMSVLEWFTKFLSLGYLLEEVLPLGLFFLLGAVLFSVGNNRGRKLKKFRKYLSMIGNQKSVYIPSLASVLGKKPRQVTEDLEEMLDRDFFPQGYIDAGRQTLVLEEAAFTAPVNEEPEVTDDTLRRIRAINDAIAHPEISAKIDRIEELTGKILTLLEERPEKAGELRSFMSYYLPQTLKILEYYAKLEAQGIGGDNITEAKKKIENMMDKLVEGYETQLDRLFANDVLDISADLKVMEQMMEKDGLAVENELKF